MRFSELVATSRDVASVSARTAKIEHLARILSRLAPHEIEPAVAFLSGSTRQGRIGLGWSLIQQAKSAPPAQDALLEITDVDETFERIRGASGRGSAGEKVRRLNALFARATEDEADFLVRLVAGELRQGALEGVLVEAVARASRISPSMVRRAVMMAGTLEGVARAALLEGEAALSQFIIQMFRPVQPMLAETAEDIEAAIDRLGEAGLEFKLDGARIQAHKAGDDVRIFSRGLRDVSAAVPEVVDAVRALPAREIVLDGEVIALRADGTPYPFQVTMRRFGRRLDVDRLQGELPVSPFFFDCLYVDGDALIDEPQHRRMATLTNVVPSSLVVPHEVSHSAIEGRAFFEEALRRGHEGLMAKALDAPYAAGARGQAWLKVKAPKTLDLVILAAEWGHGRRRGWLSNLHLGARDPEKHAFVMLGKTFKGLTDAMLTWQTEKLLTLEIGRDAYTVYVRPELVVEIAFNDLQASPQYPGGLALRFARVKRYREDKTSADADTMATVREVFERMTGQHAPGGTNDRRL